MQLIAELNLANINLRREKAGDGDGPIACDLKFSGEVKPEELQGLFSTESQYRRLIADRWDKDGDLTVTDSKRIPLDVEGTGCTIELSAALGAAGQLRWTEGDVDKIELVLNAGRVVTVKMRVQVHPTKEQIAQLSEWYSCDLNVSVWTRQHDLDLSSDDAKPAAAEANGNGAEKGGEMPLFTAPADDGVIVPGQKAPQRPRRSRTQATH